MVNLGGWSQELCGGTHASSAGEIGSLRIISESAISAGTRRIEAVAGLSAYEWTEQRVSLLQKLTRQLACTPDELTDRITQMQAKSKELEKNFGPSSKKVRQDLPIN